MVWNMECRGVLSHHASRKHAGMRVMKRESKSQDSVGNGGLRPHFQKRLLQEAPRPSAHHAKLKRAAILMPIIEKEDGLHMLLIRRAEHFALPSRAGRFPRRRRGRGRPKSHPNGAPRSRGGGRASPKPCRCRGGFWISIKRHQAISFSPVIGFVQKQFSPKPDQSEVAEIFDAPPFFFDEPPPTIKK